MDDTKHSVTLSILFILFILFLAVGGFFLTKHLTQDEEQSEIVEQETTSDNHKLDKDKEYIYFLNDKFISMEPDITYQDVVINLNTAETINKTLKTEMDSIRESVKYISDNEFDPNRETLYDEENIFSANERNYETHEYKEHISLVIKDYEFNCYDGSLLKSVKSYIFNIESGKLVLNTEIFDIYNTNIDEVKILIREKLNNSQTIEGEVELINIEETINGLDIPSNYALFIDKYGYLYISFVVKTSQVDYNETIKIN